MKRVETAKIVNAPVEFFETTEGMADVDRCNFMVSFWRNQDQYPAEKFADFLPRWRRRRERMEQKRQQVARMALEALEGVV